MKYIDAEKLKAAIEKGTPDELEFRAYRDFILYLIDDLQQEQPEVDLEKFTEKMNTWKARYNNYPDNIIVKGTMAFTARMFYMYPQVAREWYDSLRKVTQD